MKKASLNFFEVHVEKFILGLAGVSLLAMLWMFLVNSPNAVQYAGREVAARELNAAILSEAEALRRCIENAPADEPTVPRYSELVVRSHNASMFDSAPGAGPPLPQTLRPAAHFGEAGLAVGLEELFDTPGDVTLVTPLPPSRSAVQTGRSTLIRAKATRRGQPYSERLGFCESEQERTATTVSWVSLTAWFDRKAQEDGMTSTRYAPYRAMVYIVGIDVQRQGMLASDVWSDWTNVEADPRLPEPDVCDAVFDEVTGDWLNRAQVDRVFRQVKQARLSAVQPSFHEVLAGDEWEPPHEEPEGNAGMLPVWFHDVSVEPGRTYRYRTRVRLWNRYVGRAEALQDPTQAKRCVLVGEWSLPSDPVTAGPDTYFFLVGSRRDTQTAVVEVWKWREGSWINKRFTAGVGDVIGGVRRVRLDTPDGEGERTYVQVDFTTGAVVLDLRFDEPVGRGVAASITDVFDRGRIESLVMTYLDPLSGQVKQRVQAFDRYDPMRKKMREARLAKPDDGPPGEDPPESDGGRPPKPVPQPVVP